MSTMRFLYHCMRKTLNHFNTITRSIVPIHFIMTITPIGNQRRQLIIAETQKYIGQAENILGHAFESVNVLFDLKGQTFVRRACVYTQAYFTTLKPWDLPPFQEVRTRLKSLLISSIASSPTDKRIRPSSIPDALRSSGVRRPWVVLAG